MAPSTNRSGLRLKLGLSLEKALSLIASDAYTTESKPRRRIFKVNLRASQILIRAVAPDPGQGWELLHNLDSLNFYGWLLARIYDEYCHKDLDWFIGAALLKDQDMQRFAQTIKRQEVK